MSFFCCNALERVSIYNQECRIRPQIINEPSFYPCIVKINAVVVVITLMIHMQKYVFLMLLKTWMSRYLIVCQERMKKNISNGMKHVNVNVD